jgi:hypothetical protein
MSILGDFPKEARTGNVANGGPQSRPECCREKKFDLHLSGLKPKIIGRLAHSLVTILTELPCLLIVSLNIYYVNKEL